MSTSPNNSERQCQSCGEPLPKDAPQGLCPKCLGQAALDSGPGSSASAAYSPTVQVRPTAPRIADIAAHFPQLEILELLGQGGMGVVYKARQPKLDRLVALKILPKDNADPAFAERFQREARALAKLSHPNIVAIHDVGFAPTPLTRPSDTLSPRPMRGEGRGEGSQPATPNAKPETSESGYYFLLMEYVDGANLRQMQRAKQLTPEEALAIVPKICEALQFAHDEGIVHRDIKPENILVDKKGRVKIADFGLAKLLGKDHTDKSLTGTEQIMGTPHYMAPEQMEATHSVDHRADIYSLGVVFYEMLTGSLPRGRFEAPSKRVQVDVRLDDVVLKTLEYSPDRRYQHASEVKTDVESISSHGARVPPAARFAGHAASTEVIAKRLSTPAELLMLTAGAALLVAVGVWHWLYLRGGSALSETRATLTGMSFCLAFYGVTLGTVSVVVRRLRARLTCLVLTALVGVVVPVVAGVNVIMEFDHIPQWPAVIPLWLGMPLAVWIIALLLQPAVREAFARRIEERRPNTQSGEPPSSRVDSTLPFAGDVETARQAVKNPATGLFVSGILYWVAIPFAFFILLKNRDFARPTEINLMVSLGFVPLVVGTLLVLAGASMKRLEGYKLAVFASVLPFFVLAAKLIGLTFRTLAIAPGDWIAAPMGLWALIVLRRPEVKAAFQPNTKLADKDAYLTKAPPTLPEPATASSAPVELGAPSSGFSGTQALAGKAKWGAICAAIGFLACLTVFILVSNMAYYLGLVADGEKTIPDRFWPVILVLTPFCVVLPVAATMLGWQAIREIRTSAGQLSGLGLALFAGLLFPLLLLDATVAAFCSSLADFVGGMLHWDYRTKEGLWGSLSLLACIVIDYGLIIRAWNSVSSKDDETGQPAAHAQSLDHRVSEIFTKRLPGWFNARAQWVQNFVLNSLLAVLLLGLLAAFSFQLKHDTATPPEQGIARVITTIQLGQPSPWLTFATGGLKSGVAFHLFASSLWIGFLGVAAFWLHEHLRRSRPGFDLEIDRRTQRKWGIALAAFVVVLTLAIVITIVKGTKAFEKSAQTALTTSVRPRHPEGPASAPTTAIRETPPSFGHVTHEGRFSDYALEAPVNHRVNVWVEWRQNGKRITLPDFDLADSFTPAKGKRFTGYLDFVFGSQPSLPEAPTVQWRWGLRGSDALTGRAGIAKDPFAGLPKRDSSYGHQPVKTLRSGEEVTLLVVRGDADQLEGQPWDPAMAGRADMEMHLKARIDAVPEEELGELPQTSKSIPAPVPAGKERRSN